MYKILITTSTFDLSNFHENLEKINSNFEICTNPFKTKMNEEQISSMLDENVIAMIAGTEPLTESVLKNAKSFLKIY